ncbi:hypothetical protein N0V88_003383 [Collariella sp. IMI 366227]|nr:hypothetical protein N0V88_003383 [Collariella sp. IMI 366227]
MGLFSRHAEPAPQPVYEEPPKKHGLFGNRHNSPARAPPTTTATTHGTHGIHGSRRSSSLSSSSPDRGRTGGGLLSRGFGSGSHSGIDPSILAARERVMSAEAAEREADRAMIAARESVREARDHVRRLELEAKEDARLAKIKQAQAKEVSKRGKHLGRHDY